MQTKVFDKISTQELNKMLVCFEANNLKYTKDTTILSNVSNTTKVGVIISGDAQIIRYNYNGSRTIIDNLSEGDIFGAFSLSTSEDLYIVSKTNSEIVMFDYSKIINRCKKNCPYHNQLVDNIMQILSSKIKLNSERIEVLSKKTIRDKLLAYFSSLSKKQITKNILLPFTLTDLADYLSIDRSAMMREIKNMKDDGLINAKGKKITLNY